MVTKSGDALDIARAKLKELRSVSSRPYVVKFFMDQSVERYGTYATMTVATEPDSFLRAVAAELPRALEARPMGEEQAALEQVLPQICDLWAKLRGYKADNVHEERRLIVGAADPESRMVCLNDGQHSVEENGVATMVEATNAEG